MTGPVDDDVDVATLARVRDLLTRVPATAPPSVHREVRSSEGSGAAPLPRRR